MKLRIFITIITGLFTLSCMNDLEVQQKSAIISTNMWQVEDDALAAMYGMYAQLRIALSTNYIYWGDYRAGTYGRGIQYSSSADNLYNNVLTSSNIGTNWEGLYTTVNDCNQLIKYVPEVSFRSQETKDEILANAYFVRAFSYYLIVRIWGDAPLLLSGFESDKQDDLFPERTDATLIYDQIGADIDMALSYMPEGALDTYLASVGAINMLKTDFYLWKYQVLGAGASALESAEQAVDDVLTNGNYQLLGDYADVFNVKGNNEVVFAVHFRKDEYEGGYPEDYLIPLGNFSSSQDLIETEVKIGSHAQWYFFSEDLETLLTEDPDDSRRPVNFMSYTDNDAGVTYKWINKFPGEWNNATRYFTSDLPIYRFAEAILFKAEIENERDGDPIPHLNQVAERAYGTSDYYSPALTYEQVKEALLDERMKEFAAEGKTWWDHIRLGLAFTRIPSLMGREGETNILLWPVSNASIDDNPKIIQTEGYF